MHDLVEHYAEGIHYSGCSVSSEFSCNYNPIIFETVFFSLYENKVLQLMSAVASLERFGVRYLAFIK